MKEVHSNMYSLNLYYVTKLMIDIPGVLLTTYVATTITYLIVGLENSFSSWLFYCNFFELTKNSHSLSLLFADT